MLIHHWKEQNGAMAEGVMCLTARERVLMIRLMEKLEKHPTYAKTLGIEATGAVNNQNMESDPKGLTSA